MSDFNLKEQWPKWTRAQQEAYEKEFRRAICPYCGEEVPVSEQGLIDTWHISLCTLVDKKSGASWMGIFLKADSGHKLIASPQALRRLKETNTINFADFVAETFNWMVKNKVYHAYISFSRDYFKMDFEIMGVS
jgi:hypothetical protein